MPHLCTCLALLLVACGPAPAPDAPIAPIHYAEVDADLDFVHYNGFSGHYYYVETFGPGSAFFDYDGDGWQDIYLVNGSYLEGLAPNSLPVNQLYRNQGDGTFSNHSATTGAADPGYGMGVAAADFDNDGDQDLYLTNFGSNALYRNDGGRYVDITTATGVGDPRWSTSAAFLDFDLDGDLDLYVANYVDFDLDRNIICKEGKIRTYCRPQAYQPLGDILYRNDGTGFADVTRAAGIELEGRGLGVALSDFDWDGDTDIYVANDGMMNFLYENRRGSFAEIGLQAGTRYNEDGRAEAGMGVDFGDYDNDGHQDIFVTNFGFETNTLYRNSGEGYFVDVVDRLGLAAPTYDPLGFGIKFLDYDNDADLDLFVANGHVLDLMDEIDTTATLSYYQTNQLLRNDGGTGFADISAQAGASFAVKNVGRGTAVADYDNDGDLDLLVNGVADPPRLLRNDGGNQRHWLIVELIGAVHRDALGAVVKATFAATTQIRERQSGGSYLSSHDPRLHFGLGTATHVDLEIRWPDGQLQHLSAVAANQILHLVQPTTP
ncbi:MAG: CRTAC1 family protein [Alphaproteobacteria bacterium]